MIPGTLICYTMLIFRTMYPPPPCYLLQPDLPIRSLSFLGQDFLSIPVSSEMMSSFTSFHCSKQFVNPRAASCCHTFVLPKKDGRATSCTWNVFRYKGKPQITMISHLFLFYQYTRCCDSGKVGLGNEVLAEQSGDEALCKHELDNIIYIILYIISYYIIYLYYSELLFGHGAFLFPLNAWQKRSL